MQNQLDHPTTKPHLSPSHSPLQKHPLFYVLLALTLLCLLNLVKAVPKVAGYDPAGYYAWSQALLTNHNFDATPFVPEWTQDNLFPRIVVAGQVVAVNKYPIGWSIATFPAMALGQFLTWAADRWAHKDWPLDCSSALTVRLSWMAVYLWAIAGLIAAYHALCRLFTPQRAAWLIACAWLGTAAFAHTWKDPGLSHGISMAFLAINFALAVRHLRRPTLSTEFLWGLFAGLVICTRLVNVVLLLPALFLMLLTAESINEEMDGDLLNCLRFRDRAPQHLGRLALAATLGALPVLFLQSFAWHMNYGVWFFNGYSYTGEGFAFDPHNLLRMLLTSYHGVLWRHPLLILSWIGLFAGTLREKALPARILSALCGLVLLEQVLQYGSWPSYSDIDGVRWTTDTLIFSAFGLGMLARHWLTMNTTRGRAFTCTIAGASAFMLILQIFVFKAFID